MAKVPDDKFEGEDMKCSTCIHNGVCKFINTLLKYQAEIKREEGLEAHIYCNQYLQKSFIPEMILNPEYFGSVGVRDERSDNCGQSPR